MITLPTDTNSGKIEERYVTPKETSKYFGKDYTYFSIGIIKGMLRLPMGVGLLHSGMRKGVKAGWDKKAMGKDMYIFSSCISFPPD